MAVNSVIYEQLCALMKKDNILLEEPMGDHTTFQVGGPAAYFLKPESTEELARVLKYFQAIDMEYYCIGNGSNLLVSDKGFDGAIVQLGKNMSAITVAGDMVIAQAGARLSQVANTTMEHGLAGLEFAAGIPGTAGGAVVMNAGAYDGDMKQVIENVRVLTKDGEELLLSNGEMEFGYRTSVLKKHPMAVLEVFYRLEHGDRETIAKTIEELMRRRREKQPLEYPSAGSTFKRPEGHYAGKLIMEAGMGGFTIGGAKVSDKHCGFIINANHATAADIYDCIKEVRERVWKVHNVSLEPEVCMIGEF